MNKEKKEFTFINLFAGIGGFHIAMHEAGGKRLFSSQIDKFARTTYEHNFSKISPELFESGSFNEDNTGYKNIYQWIRKYIRVNKNGLSLSGIYSPSYKTSTDKKLYE